MFDAFGVVWDATGVFDVCAERVGIEVVVETEGFVETESVVETEVFVEAEVVEIGVVQNVEGVNFESHYDAYCSTRCLQSRSNLGQQVRVREVGRLA